MHHILSLFKLFPTKTNAYAFRVVFQNKSLNFCGTFAQILEDNKSLSCSIGTQNQSDGGRDKFGSLFKSDALVNASKQEHKMDYESIRGQKSSVSLTRRFSSVPHFFMREDREYIKEAGKISARLDAGRESFNV